MSTPWATYGLTARGRLQKATSARAGNDPQQRRRRSVARSAVRGVDPTPLGHRREAVGQSEHGLGRSEQEVAVMLGNPGDALEHGSLGLPVEIDQHVAAEHHVEEAETREISE